MERAPAMPENPQKHATLWQKIIGLFVAWQLVFLVSTNAIAFLPIAEAEDGELTDSRGPLPGETPDSRLEPIKVLNDGMMAWAQATGQIQAWWLFAPCFPPDATFPLVTLHWNHGESEDVQLHSHQEPRDPSFYVRLPGSSDRLFHYEMRLGLVAALLSEESLEKHASEWRDLFKGRVERQWKSLRAYMKWRTESYLLEHADLPMPDEISFSILAYRTPDPGVLPPHWTPPLQQKLARWLPSRPDQSDCLPLEYYDQVQKCFLPLPKE
jgi:hypothetical protein